MHGNVTDILAYDYFFYVNCGVTGPLMPKKDENVPWTSKFIEKMVGYVKMVGLSHNCRYGTHIQSMVYCLDKVSIKLVKESDCVFDCRYLKPLNLSSDDFKYEVIDRYEVGMGTLILSKGYGITSLTRPKIITSENSDSCLDRDLWLSTELNLTYGKIPSLEEIMFFKTSRILTKETAELINFTGNIWWKW
jgi:hypothetical protein